MLTSALEATLDCLVLAGSAAEIYRQHPDVKNKHWKEIRSDLASLIGDGNDTDLAKRLRGRWAKQLELLVSDYHYTNMDEADRDIFCRYLLEIDRETQDAGY